MTREFRVLAALCVAVFVQSSAALAAGEPQPKVLWNFDRMERGRALNAVKGGLNVQPLMEVEARPGVGTDGSAAAYVEKGFSPQCAFLALDWDAFTVDLMFKLAEPVNTAEGNALLSYSFAPWRRSNFRVMILRDGRLETRFVRVKSDEAAAVEWTATSEPVFLGTTWHGLRATCDRNGLFKLYLDGKTVISKEGAPGIRGIKMKSPEWYPLLRLGANDDDTQNFRALLNGFLEDVALYDEALGAPEAVVVEADYSNVVMPEYKTEGVLPVDVLVPAADGSLATGRFRVNEREVGALGHWMQAEKKFLDCAATARMTIGDETIVVDITCPVPAGMEIKKSAHTVWSGDEVEFFIQPDVTKPAFLQYCVNAAGLKAGLRQFDRSTSDKSFKSAFTAEVREDAQGYGVTMRIPRKEIFATLPKDGDIYRVNFVRIGETGGGISPWANVGHNLHNPAKFGRVVSGGTKAYFKRRLAAAKTEAAAFPSAGARAAADRAYAALAAAVAAHGGEAAAFAPLEVMFERYGQTLVAIRQGGQPLLVYAAADPWRNALEPAAETKPLEKIRIAAARNSKAWYPLTVKNQTAREFLGQLKVFDKGPGFEFGNEGTQGVARHFRAYEAIPADIGGGSMSYDPFGPLTMGTLVRIAPTSLAALWLELDTHGLAAGRHFAVLVLKRERPGFPTARIPVEVEIVDADLETVRFDKASYDGLTYCTNKVSLQKFLSVEGGNVMFTGSWPGAWAKKQKDGGWGETNYDVLDAKIDARLAGGVPKDRLIVWYCCAVNLYWNGPRKLNGDVNCNLKDPDWAPGVQFSVRALRDHLKGKYGFGYDQLIFYVVDEPDATKPVDDPELKNSMAQAYHAAKVIKAADPKLKTFTNPHAYGAYAADRFLGTLKRLEECFDIIEFFRPNLTPEVLAHTKDFKFEYWTYNIIGTTVPPTVYRGDVWRNLRDGFRPLTPFWHLDAMAGCDGFDPSDSSSSEARESTDYGSVYVDYDSGIALTSRRQTAYDMGCEEAKLVLFLRQKFAGDAAKLTEVEAIVKRAADADSMAAFNAAHWKLLRMAK